MCVTARRRTYNTGTTAALYLLSSGTCYAPDCAQPTVRVLDGEPVVNLEIAHIYALEEGGPRYRATYTVEQLNHFSNLLLLCVGHHKLVDKIRPEDFPAPMLLGWKHVRESGQGLSDLRTDPDLNADILEEMIMISAQEMTDRIDAALEKLEAIDAGVAQVLRVLSEQSAIETWRGAVDPDQVASLARSARLLAELPTLAASLSTAATTLSKIPWEMVAAADRTRHHREY